MKKRNLLYYLLFSITLIFIFSKILMPSKITSLSMSPSYVKNEHIITLGIFNSYKNGDPIIFKLDNHKNNVFKRIVASEGDKVKTKNGILFLMKKNTNIWIEKPFEKYTFYEEGYESKYFDINGIITIKPNHFWVMGDNRNNSLDSRYFGQINISQIIGKVILSY